MAHIKRKSIAHIGGDKGVIAPSKSVITLATVRAKRRLDVNLFM